jgi:hypothetical protein
MSCPTCGSATVAGARFCGVCGTTLAASPPSAPPPAAAQSGPAILQQYSQPLPMQERQFSGNMGFLNSVPFPPGIGLLALGGAVLAILGSLLSWVPGLSAWGLNLIGVLTFSKTNLVGGLPVGLVYLASALVLAPYFTHKPPPRQYVVLLGFITTGVAAITLLRILTFGQGASFGFGLIVSAAGGVGILLEGLKGGMRPTGAREATVAMPQAQGTPSAPPPPPAQYAAPPAAPQYAAPAPPPPPPPPPQYAASPPASAPAAASAQVFCPNCGRPATGKFCGSCGSAIG